MEAFGLTILQDQITGSSTALLEPTRIVGLLLVVAFVALYARGRILASKVVPTAPAAIAKIDRLVHESIETGRPVHVAPGTGAVGGALTAETLAGLNLGQQLSSRLATGGVATIRSSPDPVAFAALAGFGRVAQPWSVAAGGGGMSTFVPDRAAYAMEAMSIAGASALGANVLVGAFGDEYLLLAHAGHEADVPLIAGSGSLGALPVLAVTSETPLLGEELFNAGPLLAGGPAQLATLLAQDGVRALTIVGIIAIAIGRSVGLFIVLP